MGTAMPSRECVEGQWNPPKHLGIVHDFPNEVIQEWKDKNTRACSKTLTWVGQWQDPETVDLESAIHAVNGANVAMIAVKTSTNKVKEDAYKRPVFVRKMLHKILTLEEMRVGTHYHIDGTTRECLVVYDQTSRHVQEISPPILEPCLMCIRRNDKRASEIDLDWLVRTIMQCKREEDNELAKLPIPPEKISEICREVEGELIDAYGVNEAANEVEDIDFYTQEEVQEEARDELLEEKHMTAEQKEKMRLRKEEEERQEREERDERRDQKRMSSLLDKVRSSKMGQFLTEEQMKAKKEEVEEEEEEEFLESDHQFDEKAAGAVIGH